MTTMAVSETTRRVELCERGLARDSGRTRRVRSGKQAVVWTAAPPANAQ